MRATNFQIYFRFNRTMLGLQLFIFEKLFSCFASGFNRTMLGLQRFVNKSESYRKNRFNRTMLGLQHEQPLENIQNTFSFNRTMLGLQRKELVLIKTLLHVSIALC